MPSQSLSSPSQNSGPGPTEPTQLSPPLTHCVVPVWHVPTREPLIAPPPGLPSSTTLLQLLSTPSHTSVKKGARVGSLSLQSRLEGEPSASASTCPSWQTLPDPA